MPPPVPAAFPRTCASSMVRPPPDRKMPPPELLAVLPWIVEQLTATVDVEPAYTPPPLPAEFPPILDDVIVRFPPPSKIPPPNPAEFPLIEDRVRMTAPSV